MQDNYKILILIFFFLIKGLTLEPYHIYYQQIISKLNKLMDPTCYLKHQLSTKPLDKIGLSTMIIPKKKRKSQVT